MSLEREGFLREKKKEKRESNFRINSKEGKQPFPQTNKISANEKMSLLRLKFNHRKGFIVTKRILITAQKRRGFSASQPVRGCRSLVLSRRDGVREGRVGRSSCPTSN